MDVSIRVAFIELYKEQLYDLLSQRREKDKENCILDIRQASNDLNIFQENVGLVPHVIEHCPISFQGGPREGRLHPGPDGAGGGDAGVHHEAAGEGVQQQSDGGYSHEQDKLQGQN